MAIPEPADQNPYVGPRPFEPGDAGRFFGRRREVRELLSLVIAHRVVLLYAASGAGKSSLLNAGLIPSLLAKGFQVLPPARLGAAPTEPRLRFDDIYTAGMIAGWAGAATTHRTPLKGISLTDYLRKVQRPIAEDGHPVRRALVIDSVRGALHRLPGALAAAAALSRRSRRRGCERPRPAHRSRPARGLPGKP
jgi:Novel STAND NTPase 1